MDARKTRIRILDLQDQYCRRCEHLQAEYTYCINHCDIGQEMHRLGMELVGETERKPREMSEKEKKRRAENRKRWDNVCQRAMDLRGQGYTYQKIAEQLGCDVSSLRKQLKKRGLGIVESEGKEIEVTRKKWDKLCKQIVVLREQGMNYKKIEEQLGCPYHALRYQLKKRGLW